MVETLPGFNLEVQKISEIRLAYYAGLFDGEGHVSLYKGNPRYSDAVDVRAIIHMGHANEVLLELKSNFGGSVQMYPPRFENYSPMSVWTVIGMKAGHFLEQIYPYLKVKRKEAELALEYHSLYKQVSPGGGFDAGYKVPYFLIARGEEIKMKIQQMHPSRPGLRVKGRKRKKTSVEGESALL